MPDPIDNGATPEVTLPQDTQQAEQPKSMDDTLRDTLRDIASRSEENSHAGEVQSDLTPAGGAEDPEAAAKRIRDAQGKFAAAPVVADPTAQATPATTPPADAEQAPAAPNTWKKEAAAIWDTIPPAARAEIARREQDFHKGVEQYKERAQYAQTMEKAMAPYMPTIQSLGVTPDRAIAELMASDHKLRHGSPQEKSAFFAQLAHNYGIDLGQAAHVMQNTDPRAYAAEQELQNARTQLQNYQQSAAQQAEAALNSEIDAFKANPAHSHFETVKPQMSALLQAGQATSLADAYEQAIYANPITRAAVLQQQATAQRAEETKKAQAAKAAASVNVQRRPAMPTAAPVGTMEDTIRDKYRQLTGAA